MKIKVKDIPIYLIFIIVIVMILLGITNAMYNLFIAKVCKKDEVISGLFFPVLFLIMWLISIYIDYKDKEIDLSKITNYFKKFKL